jgi:hypothetical protein
VELIPVEMVELILVEMVELIPVEMVAERWVLVEMVGVLVEMVVER